MYWAFVAGCSTVCQNPTSKGEGKWSFLFQDSGRVTTGTLNPNGTPDFFYIHGWFMWSAWGFLGYIMIVSNRYLKRFHWLHLWINITSGVIILVFTYVLGFLAL